MKDRSRPGKDGSATNIDRTIIVETEPWVAVESRIIREARLAKRALLEALGLRPPYRFDFDSSRSVIQFDRMVGEHVRRAP